MGHPYEELIYLAAVPPSERVLSFDPNGTSLTRPIKDVHRWQEMGVKTRELGEWSPSKAIKALGVRQVPYEPHREGIEGYVTGNALSLSPTTTNPLRALLHELGHYVLGHSYSHSTARAVRELQAETVSFAVCALLGAVTWHSVNLSRHYILIQREQGARLSSDDREAVVGAIRTVYIAGS